MQNRVKPQQRQAERALREAQLALEAAQKELAVLRESEERYRLITEVVANLTYTYRIEADGAFVSSSYSSRSSFWRSARRI